MEQPGKMLVFFRLFPPFVRSSFSHRCLVQLDPDYDPSWICAEAFKNWLVDRLQCYQNTYRNNLSPPMTTQTSESSSTQQTAAVRPNSTGQIAFLSGLVLMVDCCTL